MALVWVHQKRVRHSVECVACGEHSPIDEREFGPRDNTRRLLEDLRFHRDSPRAQLRLIVRRRAGDNPIEVFRIALGLHQGLPPARGATGPVREPWRAIVERRDDGFRFHRHLVNGAIREIYDFFRMSDRERRIRAAVSRVRRCCRVTLLQRRGQRAIADDSGPAAVADGLELPVPGHGGQPNLNPDVRVRRWRERCRHSAKGWQLAELRHRRARSRQSESSGRHHLGQRNRSGRER